MKFLKRFKSHDDYEAFTATTEFITPNISTCKKEGDVHYNPIHDYSQDYLTFVALEDGTFTFSGNAIQYSVDDGETWAELPSNTASPTVTSGKKIMWKQTGLTPNLTVGIGIFSSTNKFEVEGNIMSLYYGDDFQDKRDLSGKNDAFWGLFSGNTKVVSAENLSLPATTLAPSCYSYMFDSCTSLTSAPELPAATLANYCYQGMFYGCTSLTSAPELPATTLTESCYDSMFYNCTSLTSAPELPAATLANYCYQGMFYGCTKLNSITCLATDISASDCTSNWVYGVAQSGTFTKAASMASWPKDTSGIPNGWTVQNA